ncbi:hypothetical protein AOQ72_04915 [Bradyrhizobium yuanmingense]|uniref:Uncharacterized protein n=1 Tax=Bradyrhizobium yuanmingense TaxID=108015 RepID=A0A0R3BRV0_9BRAD|nr:hypothetical protein [Bradyrhizobium yuanmingense]KRP85070.1 hypothetical protein AOQ72_04915 [Bradyrhizobium yuanmingense]
MIRPNDDLESIRAEEEQLERRLEELRNRRAALEEKTPAKPAVTTTSKKSSARPLRDVVLEVLGEARVPLNSLLLASVIRAWLGRTVPSSRFGTLSIDETKSYDSSRPRPVYLCHCLTWDRGEAVKRFWARSDWALMDRVMGPMSGRLLFMKGAAWAIRLAKAVDAGDLIAADPDVLRYVAADQARDAGMIVKRGNFPFDEWLEAISTAISRHEADDVAIRQAAAADISHLPERALLFGAPAGFVSLPGSHKDWRSARDER